MLNFLWGNQSKQTPATPKSAEETAEQLENTIFALELKQTSELETAAKYDAEARKYVHSDKKRAEMALRQRNDYRTRAEQHGAQIRKLSETLRTIGATSENIELAETYKASATTLGSLIKTTQGYNVEDIVDELDDHMKDAKDLNEAMARPFGGEAMAEEMDEELRAEMESWGSSAAEPRRSEGEVASPVAPPRSGGAVSTKVPEADFDLPDIPQKSRKDGSTAATVRLPV